MVLMQYTYGRFSKASLSSFFLFPFAVFRPGQEAVLNAMMLKQVSLLHSGFLLANSWAPLQRPDLTRSFYGAAGGAPQAGSHWVQPAFLEGCKSPSPS